MMRRLCALCIVAATGVALPALGQPRVPPRIDILVRDAPELEGRLRDELESAGYATSVLPQDDDGAELVLDDAAAITLLARAQRGGYEIWLRDRVTQETVMREVAATTDVSAVALRAVELVRVAILERKQRRAAPPSTKAPRPVPEPPTVPPEKASPRAEEPSRPVIRSREPRSAEYLIEPRSAPRTAVASAELSGIWFHDVTGGESSAGIEASGGIFYPRFIQTRLSARYLVRMPSLRVGDAGSIDTRLGQAGVAVALHSVDPAASVSPFLELGVDFMWLRLRGNPSSPVQLGLRKNSFSAYPHVGTGLTIGGESFPLRLRTQLAVGVAFPRQRFTIIGESRSWAWPTVEGTLGLQYLFR